MIVVPHWFLWGEKFGSDAAVFGFFVISGYSMAHSIQEKPRDFYRRRLQRLYPIYLLGLVLAAVPYIVFGPQFFAGGFGEVEAPRTLWPYLAQFAFLQNIVVGPIRTNPVVWTLSCEAIFYLFTPLFARCSSRTLLGMLGVSALLHLLHPQLRVFNYVDALYALNPLFLLWVWLSGFLYYRHRGDDWAMLGTVALGSFFLCLFPAAICPLAPASFAAGTLLLCLAHRLPVPSRHLPRLTRAGNYLGNLSYPLYMVHNPILLLIAGSVSGAVNSRVPVISIPLIVYGAALLAYHIVDAPYQRYARRRSRAALSAVPVS